MFYTEEEIKRYMEILHKYTNCGVARGVIGGTESPYSKCCNCQRDDCFSIYSGYKICENCSVFKWSCIGIS